MIAREALDRGEMLLAAHTMSGESSAYASRNAAANCSTAGFCIEHEPRREDRGLSMRARPNPSRSASSLSVADWNVTNFALESVSFSSPTKSNVVGSRKAKTIRMPLGFSRTRQVAPALSEWLGHRRYTTCCTMPHETPSRTHSVVWSAQRREVSWQVVRLPIETAGHRSVQFRTAQSARRTVSVSRPVGLGGTGNELAGPTVTRNVPEILNDPTASSRVLASPRCEAPSTASGGVAGFLRVASPCKVS